MGYFERRPDLCEFQETIVALKAAAESCSRQLRAWADSLQNSDIRGQRHLNEQSHAEWKKNREHVEQRRKAEAMERSMVAKLPADHPMRKERERKNGAL